MLQFDPKERRTVKNIPKPVLQSVVLPVIRGVLDVSNKVRVSGGVAGNFMVDENGNRLVTESGDFIIWS